MGLEMTDYIDWELLQKENIVSKLEYLTLLEKMRPYERTPNETLEVRLAKMLKSLPKEYHTAAIASVASTIYITEEMRIEAWESLFYQFKYDFRHNEHIDVNLNDVHFFELDRDNLYDEFFRAANVRHIVPNPSIYGRLDDTSPFISVDILIDYLMRLDSDTITDKEIFELQELCRKKVWVLLVDISLSGDSVCSEIKKLNSIINKIFKLEDVDFNVFVQVLTAEGQRRIGSIQRKLGYGGFSLYSAINIPYSFAFNYEHNEDMAFSIYRNQMLSDKIEGLCNYFANYILKRDRCPLTKAINKQYSENDKIKIAKYGYGGLGWNVVTQRNAPNNSLPFLWCSSDNYTPPFPRAESHGVPVVDSNIMTGMNEGSQINNSKKQWVNEVLKSDKDSAGKRCEEIHSKYIARINKK